MITKKTLFVSIILLIILIVVITVFSMSLAYAPVEGPLKSALSSACQRWRALGCSLDKMGGVVVPYKMSGQSEEQPTPLTALCELNNIKTTTIDGVNECAAWCGCQN